MNDTISLSETDLANLRERIDHVFTSQKAHHQEVKRTGVKERRAKLKRMLEWLYDHQTEIHAAAVEDFSKPAPEVDLTEIWSTATEIKHTLRHLKRWMKPKPVPRTLALLTARAWVQYEPRGVVLIISPWNYPFTLTLGPLTMALAAGNCAILKPSEFTPHSSRLISNMVTELFPDNEVSVFEGDKTVAIELLKKPFDHIYFTGGSETGKKVMAAAARHLSSITLELGGKSPTIVDETADIEDAATKITWGKYLTCGQTCIAPDYLLVHISQHDRLVEAIKEKIQQFFGEDEMEQRSCPDYARIVNARQYQHLQRLLQEAKDRGARIEIGGLDDDAECYLPPTLITNVDPETSIMQEEIFGPLLPVISYQTLEEALELINTKPKPLALYIFSKNKRNIDTILQSTSAGGTVINDVLLHFLQMNLPFGGVNNSGIGQAHGFYGFRTFSHERAIVKNIHLSPLKLLSPPYTPRVKRLIRLISRYI
jgi:aldehyde dehydrogenase (NAD+)